jgi:hypothetical protein
MSMRCQGGREHERQLRHRSGVGHAHAGPLREGVALALVLLACGQASSGDNDGAAALGGTENEPASDETASAGGAGYPGRPGSGERLPAEAPACDERRYAKITTVEVMTVAGDGAANVVRSEASLDGRVIARGAGTPDELRELPIGFDAAGPTGWLWIEGFPAQDADARVAPPGAGNAGVDAGAEGGASGAVRWLILGPSELASLPVSDDDELHVDVERRPSPFYSSPYMKLEVTSNGRLLIFDVTRPLEMAQTDSGMVYARGARRCQTSDECYYYYEHAIEVTAPDGSSATLDPGASTDIGGYRVRHGNTGSTSLAEAGIDVNNFCADRAGPSNYSALTAILLPGAD